MWGTSSGDGGIHNQESSGLLRDGQKARVDAQLIRQLGPDSYSVF